MEMEWIGEQSPYEDRTGWEMRMIGRECLVCGEQLTNVEDVGEICWHCDDPIPWGWEIAQGAQ
jgi:hypothetical protein